MIWPPEGDDQKDYFNVCFWWDFTTLCTDGRGYFVLNSEYKQAQTTKYAPKADNQQYLYNYITRHVMC